MQAELSEELELEHETQDRGDAFTPEAEDPEAASSDDGAEPPEGDEDDAQTADEEPEGEGESEAPHSIPQARFNEVNERYKAEREARLALEEELARARGQRPAPEGTDAGKAAAPFDLEAAEAQYLDAVLEGDKATARDLHKQIRAHEREQLKAQLREETLSQLQRDEQARDSERLMQTALALYAKYPELDESHKGHDADTVETVLALRDRYIQNGAKPADALEKAADKVCGKALKAAAPSSAAPAAPAAKAGVGKNLAREAQIPPRDAGKGTRSQPVDYASLSDAEFSRLSPEDKARARGDFL